MTSSTDNSDLKELATRLQRDGPVKTWPASSRRIRILFNNSYIADTEQALYVWEHKYYPALYLPKSCFTKEVEWKSSDSVGDAQLLEMGLGNKKTNRVISFEQVNSGPAEGLQALIRVEFKAVDQWFEEDVPIFVHPKDPFKRVDTLPSSKTIEVSVDGVPLAHAKFSVHLFETMLPCRYYLPMTAINQSLLRPSTTRTQCPYKGEAEYYDVVLPGPSGERVFKDIVWYYTHPNLECASMAGLGCFYNEKVDVFVDGRKEEKPKTHFA